MYLTELTFIVENTYPKPSSPEMIPLLKIGRIANTVRYVGYPNALLPLITSSCSVRTAFTLINLTCRNIQKSQSLRYVFRRVPAVRASKHLFNVTWFFSSSRSLIFSLTQKFLTTTLSINFHTTTSHVQAQMKSKVLLYFVLYSCARSLQFSNSRQQTTNAKTLRESCIRCQEA